MCMLHCATDVLKQKMSSDFAVPFSITILGKTSSMQNAPSVDWWLVHCQLRMRYPRHREIHVQHRIHCPLDSRRSTNQDSSFTEDKAQCHRIRFFVDRKHVFHPVGCPISERFKQGV